MKLFRWNMLTDGELNKFAAVCDRAGYLRGFQKGEGIDDLRKRRIEELNGYPRTFQQAALWKECRDWTARTVDAQVRAIAIERGVDW